MVLLKRIPWIRLLIKLYNFNGKTLTYRKDEYRSVSGEFEMRSWYKKIIKHESDYTLCYSVNSNNTWGTFHGSTNTCGAINEKVYVIIFSDDIVGGSSMYLLRYCYCIPQ